MSVNSTSPATLFGGTWEQIKDTFLLGSGSYTLGATGGEATHTLTPDELPAHNHSLRVSWNNSTGYGQAFTESTSTHMTVDVDGTMTGYTGSNQAHNNMPPYLVVNIWKRTA